MKTLFIIFIITLVLIIIGVNSIYKRVRKFFNSFIPPEETNRMNKQKNNDQVVYEKDDVVVMKGEAGKKKHDKSDRNKDE